MLSLREHPISLSSSAAWSLPLETPHLGSKDITAPTTNQNETTDFLNGSILNVKVAAEVQMSLQAEHPTVIKELFHLPEISFLYWTSPTSATACYPYLSIQGSSFTPHLRCSSVFM